MSLFRKPKKNIRLRPLLAEEDPAEAEFNNNCDPENQSAVSILNEENCQKLKKKKKKDKCLKESNGKSTLLSFDEELEGDDGEIFKVKKSSQSRRIQKQLQKERKKKLKDRLEEDDEDSVKEEERDDDLDTSPGISIKPYYKVVNGTEAEAMDLESSDEDDAKSSHRQPQPLDHFRQVLESGEIPNAAMIHAARKRRQQAREMGPVIPLEPEADGDKSRLVREDDDDRSDDDGRISFSINLSARERERRQEAFQEAEDFNYRSGSDKGEEEMDRWEAQQIQKGFRISQFPSAAQEAVISKYGLSQGATVTDPKELLNSILSRPPPEKPVIERRQQDLTLEGIKRSIRERLASLKEVNRRHLLDCDKLHDDLIQYDLDITQAKTEAPRLAWRYNFYQEMRGYVSDLVECFDAKMIEIERIEKNMHNLYKLKAVNIMQRRRQDIKDQSDEYSEMAALIMNTANADNFIKNVDEGRIRRAAEREGRRMRRRRNREIKSSEIAHYDGMSSDDEVTESENARFNQDKENLEKDAKGALSDVLDEFSTFEGIKEKFESWKVQDSDAYQEAYINLCLPKLFSPLIRLHLVCWNPLFEEGPDLDKMKWFGTLALFGVPENETEDDLKNDPDFLLLPHIVEKIILLKLTYIVKEMWDPFSTGQNLKLVRLIQRLIEDYPTMSESSKYVQGLFRTIIARMRETLEKDVFIPIYPKALLDNTKCGASAFVQRQFWSGVKILRNFLTWQGTLHDSILQELALDGLLNKYLLLMLQTSSTADSLEKIKMITSTLPRWWCTKNSPPQVQRLVQTILIAAEKMEVMAPNYREHAYEAVTLLRSLGAKIEAEKVQKLLLGSVS